MISGIGTDIVEVKRVRDSLERWGVRFQSKILNALEVRDFDSIDLAGNYLARQFAAKEAITKALGTGMSKGVDLRDIIILREISGAPVVQLQGGAKKQAELQGISSILVSISEERTHTIAFAIALKSA